MHCTRQRRVGDCVSAAEACRHWAVAARGVLSAVPLARVRRDVLLDAYWCAFGPDDPVVLVLRSHVPSWEAGVSQLCSHTCSVLWPLWCALLLWCARFLTAHFYARACGTGPASVAQRVAQHARVPSRIRKELWSKSKMAAGGLPLPTRLEHLAPVVIIEVPQRAPPQAPARLHAALHGVVRHVVVAMPPQPGAWIAAVCLSSSSHCHPRVRNCRGGKAATRGR